MDFFNKILQGDTIETMKQLPEKSFDFCFADPPYFMQVEEGKNYIVSKEVNLTVVMMPGINFLLWMTIKNLPNNGFQK